MAAGVLNQARRDLRRFRSATSKHGRELYLDAHRWISADEHSWPFSFLNVCHALDLAPEIVRQEIMSDLSVGQFGYWARGFRRSLNRFLATGVGDGSFQNSTSSAAI